jgi:iron complex transport system ATP-binding protein
MRLQARGVTVRYRSVTAVDRVDLDVAPGEVLALLGANGSGKSSLMRVLAGLGRHEGTILWQGGTEAVGYMPQDNASAAALTAFEVVLLGRLRRLSLRPGAVDLAATEAALAELGIQALAGRRIGTLSGGQRQLVFLAQVLAAAPRALLLDEPTSALDIAHQVQVLGMVRDVARRRGITAIVVLHDINAAARLADRIALLQAGRLVAVGPPAEVLQAVRLRAAYDVEVAVGPGPDGALVVVPLQAAAR